MLQPGSRVISGSSILQSIQVEGIWKQAEESTKVVNQKLHFYLGRLAVVATLCTVLITGMANNTNALVSENAWTIGWGGIGYDGGVIAQPLDDGSIITLSLIHI